MQGYKTSCRVKVNADGDWQIMPPDGRTTRIGYSSVGWTPGPLDNNDLLVSGELLVNDAVTGANGFAAGGDPEILGEIEFSLMDRPTTSTFALRLRSEEVTIPVGQGAAGIVSNTGMFQPRTVIFMVFARVTQAPGGGATTFEVAPDGTPADQLIINQPVAVGEQSNSAEDSDGTHDGPFWHNLAIGIGLTIKTNANVTGSDMKIRLGVVYGHLWNFGS